MAWCDNINIWGAQPRINRPLPLVVSSKPYSEIHFSNSSVLLPSLITQMNGLFDASKPKPSSTNWAGNALHILPRHEYITELGSCESSHFKHWCSSMETLLPLSDLSKLSLLQRETGPTHHTLPFLAFLYSSTYFGSNSSKVFMTTPYEAISAANICSVKSSSFGSGGNGSCDLVDSIWSGKPGKIKDSESESMLSRTLDKCKLRRHK
ncbi:hypothetical protein PanWU01x14_367080 [Parasponia andersonii]|uniref:Uncharacterized protein n=1 Tax=Parasponia andersonii TaxID=3476 RepID=A0A2P5A5E9_PARAD|nr:hypothetical protein PanWU01x14_367080 [Parasponia andersonii]